MSTPLRLGEHIAPYEHLTIGTYVELRYHRSSFGRIVDIVEEVADNFDKRPYKIFLLRLDDGTFITEFPEYLDEAYPPKPHLVIDNGGVSCW